MLPATNARGWTLRAQQVQEDTAITAGVGKSLGMRHLEQEQNPSQAVASKQEAQLLATSHLQMERDIHAVEYFIDQPGCQSRCCPIMFPPSCYLAPVAGQGKDSFDPLTID